MKSITVLAPFVATAHATGVLLPLYLYPAKIYDDGAQNWQPAIKAVKDNAASNLPWQIVINPGDGPGATKNPGNDDLNYINGTAQFNALPGVTVSGYVHNTNGKQPMEALKANITAWAGWSTYTAADIGVRGIFFDEAIEASGISDGSGYDYLNEAIQFARAAFSQPITITCNFGAKPHDSYYGICDIIIAFESCLSPESGALDACRGAPPYRNATTIETNIPTQFRSQAAIVIHDFTGQSVDNQPADLTTLTSYLHTIEDRGVGWTYFTTTPYETSITTPPASVENVASILANH